MTNKIEALRSDVAKICQEHIKKCEEAGVKVYISNTVRTDADQKALYAQGRIPLAEVNKLRKACGMYMLSEAENKNKVTNAQVSLYHSKGLAYDMEPLVNGNPSWDYKLPAWEVIGKIGIELGMYWGKDFPGLHDYPHFQLPDDKI
jgi:peptidoglycan LD-endopeptidase CwlK